MRGGESYWIASTEDTNYPPLEEDVSADVAVVGAGITGLTCALLLQQAGRTVVVLEAKASIGRGVTGATTGKITAGQGTVYSELERSRGASTAALYAQSQSAAVERVFELAREHAIDCDLERITHYVFAERPSELAELEAEAEAATRAGLEVELVRDPATPFPAVAALGLAGQVQFHSRKYLHGLARAFIHAGGRIHQRARVSKVEDGTPRRIELPGGTVSARDVVLATNVPFGLTGSFFARLEAHAAYAVAIPVPAGTLSDGWINVGAPTRSLRTTPLQNGDRLLVVVGENHVVGREPDPGARYDALARYARSLTDGEVAHRWSTQDQYPVDSLPYIGRLGGKTNGLYVATGFAGWGLSNGTLAGMLIRDALLGRDNEWAAIYDPARSSTVRAPRSLVSQNLGVAKELVGGKLKKRPDSLAAVAPGTGAVVDLDGKKAAVYRTEEGNVTAVSASCTHMGCTVEWNPAESTWDCPCHGSRFAVGGDVLHGPAVTPLGTISVETPVSSV